MRQLQDVAHRGYDHAGSFSIVLLENESPQTSPEQVKILQNYLDEKLLGSESTPGWNRTISLDTIQQFTKKWNRDHPSTSSMHISVFLRIFRARGYTIEDKPSNSTNAKNFCEPVFVKTNNTTDELTTGQIIQIFTKDTRNEMRELYVLIVDKCYKGTIIGTLEKHAKSGSVDIISEVTLQILQEENAGYVHATLNYHGQQKWKSKAPPTSTRGAKTHGLAYEAGRNSPRRPLAF